MPAEKSTRTPRGRLPLTVTVGDGTSPSPVSAGKVPYLTDTVTPKTRRVSKLPAAERKLALDLACRCVEEAYQAREGPALQHAAYFRAFGYKVLKKALCLKDDPRTPQDMQEISEEESVSSAVDSEAFADTAASDRRTVSPAKHRRMPGLWRTVQQLRKGGGSVGGASSADNQNKRSSIASPDNAGAAVPSPERNGFFSPRTAESLPPDEEPSCSTERPTASGRTAGPEKALDALLLAAPNKGEVQPWVWLLGAVAQRCSINSVHTGVSYLARVAKYIACEEEWLRLLVQELTPVMEHLQDQELPLNTMHALERVADRALQVGEAAVCSYRSHRSSQAQNAAILYRAVRLITLLTSWGTKDGGSMGEMFEVHLNSAATSRFHSLISSVGAPKVTPTSPTMAAPSEAQSVGGLLAVVEQLVQDVAEDAEVYQQSFPESASISLPAISARVYCQQLRPQLQAVLDRQPPANRAFFDLLEAVHQLECHALCWCPSVLGPEGAFVDDEGQLLFLPHVELWLKAMRIKLTQWSTRLLAQETWTSVSEGGVRCSKALVDMYTALCSVAEENASMAAANIAYAALLEKALSKVALQHVVSLEKLCQEQLAQQQQPVAAQLLRLRMGGGPPAAPKLWRPSRRLCAVLNDLREVRCKQGDLTATVRGSLPPAWWGALAGGGYILGSRLQLCQVEIERRFAFVLHHTVKRLMDSVTPILAQCLEEGALPTSPTQQQLQKQNLSAVAVGPLEAGPAAAAERVEPVTDALSQHLQFLAPALDPRVLRRAARELWNSCAGCLHDRLLEGGNGSDGGGGQCNSLGRVGPRLLHADAMLKRLTGWFTGPAGVELTEADEPEKARKLRKMLGLFLQVDGSCALDSVDG
ncbi:g6934 [Coccomyxa elongata]